MKKLIYFFILSSIVCTTSLFAQSIEINKDKGIVTIHDYVYNLTCSNGTDRETVCYPHGWKTLSGKDGRLIAYPSYTWSTAEGKDGRKIAYPSYTWSTAEGKDGRKIAYPSYTWSTAEGKDGRKIAYPSYTWSTAEGKDGRKIAYPSYTWSTAEGKDGRKIAYPSYTWSTAEGSDGRKVAYPNSWTKDEGLMGMKITGSQVELIFRDVNYLPLLEEYKEEFDSDTEFADFVIYTFLNHSIDNGFSNKVPSEDVFDITPPSNQCGVNSVSNGSSQCFCIEGYEWIDPADSKNYNCKLKVTIPVKEVKECGKNSSPSGAGKCVCNSGYVWEDYDNKNNLNCISIEDQEAEIQRLIDEANQMLDPQTVIITPEGNSTQYYDYYINIANELGKQAIINYQSNTDNYNVMSPVLRQELIGIALKLKKIELEYNYTCKNIFSDVRSWSPNSWVCRAAETAALNSIITRDNAKFNPESYVTITEGLAMIFNSIGLDYKNPTLEGINYYYPNIQEWQKKILAYAKSIGIIETTYIDPNRHILRGEIFFTIQTSQTQSFIDGLINNEENNN